MPAQERICHSCGTRCHRGWLHVVAQGQIKAKRTNVWDDRETVYCSEACLRTQLLGNSDEARLIKNLQRQVKDLRQQVHYPEYDPVGAEREASELRTLLRVVAEQAIVFKDADPVSTEPGSEEATRLRNAAANFLRLLRPVFEQRQR